MGRSLVQVQSSIRFSSSIVQSGGLLICAIIRGMEKRCSTCEEIKPIEAFSKNAAKKDGHTTTCESCTIAYRKGHYTRTKDKYKNSRAERRKLARKTAQRFVYEFLVLHPCMDCGETDIVVLEFDHQRDKIANISDLVRDGAPLATLRKEMEKCEVVCANDHRRRTAVQFGSYKFS